VPTQGKFNYGCKDGEAKFFAFDIFTPEGKWVKPWYVSYPDNGSGIAVDSNGLGVVPVYDVIPFNIEELKKYIDGPSTVRGANHIREGIVVTPVNERHVHGLGRLQLKLVSNAFLEKDSQ
jgi:hypothetical protein